MDLDEWSSDDSVLDVLPLDFKVTLLYESDDSCTPVGSMVFSSDEDNPLSPGQDDRRKVRKRNFRPSSRSELMDRPANEPAKTEKSVNVNNDSLMDKPPVDELPEWSDSELMPLITLKDSPVVDKTNMTRTETRCSEYCPYIKGISVNDWAVSNRPAVEAIVFRSPDRLVQDTRDKDTKWISLTYSWFHNGQVWWIVMSSSKMVSEADRPRAVDTDLTQAPETFLRHVLE